ncbi:MAG: hypothetical protein JJE13_06855 [Thermoleophilia bacterium]|nr:hypothetical protein [Thermoleophilia bacterium]
MERPTLSHLTVLLAAGALFAAGCGDEEPPADPQQVIETAFPDEGIAAGATVSATVEVASIGYEDRVLESRTLTVDPETYAEVREAITGAGGRGEGLFGLAEGIETVGTEDLDGTEVDHVTGDFDVKKLVDQLESASQEVGAAASLPGVDELDELRDKLVAAQFDLYAQSGDGAFEQLDLTLSIDDRENASPPTRIRFSLTESDPEQAQN